MSLTRTVAVALTLSAFPLIVQADDQGPIQLDNQTLDQVVAGQVNLAFEGAASAFGRVDSTSRFTVAGFTTGNQAAQSGVVTVESFGLGLGQGSSATSAATASADADYTRTFNFARAGGSQYYAYSYNFAAAAGVSIF